MLYLLDSSTLITANSKYYPVDRVPEFWEWLTYKATNGQVKMPIEMLEEIKEDRKSTRLNSSHLRTSRMPSSA